ncbi:hypothetical protein ACLOJK_005076 [Asimina triloba]
MFKHKSDQKMFSKKKKKSKSQDQQSYAISLPILLSIHVQAQVMLGYTDWELIPISSSRGIFPFTGASIPTAAVEVWQLNSATAPSYENDRDLCCHCAYLFDLAITHQNSHQQYQNNHLFESSTASKLADPTSSDSDIIFSNQECAAKKGQTHYRSRLLISLERCCHCAYLFDLAITHQNSYQRYQNNHLFESSTASKLADPTSSDSDIVFSNQECAAKISSKLADPTSSDSDIVFSNQECAAKKGQTHYRSRLLISLEGCKTVFHEKEEEDGGDDDDDDDEDDNDDNDDDDDDEAAAAAQVKSRDF